MAFAGVDRKVSRVSLRFGFLSTYPPTQCGLATFTAALSEQLAGSATGASRGVVRLLDGPGAPGPPWATPAGVVGDLVAGTPGGPERAARLLNRFDVAVVQHEYGIYGGRDGDEVLEVLRHLDVPVIVVLHTVLVYPTPHQRQVLEAVAAAADVVVVMSETARARLAAGYEIDPHLVVVIPHGAPDNRGIPAVRAGPPTVLTWGLIGPGKGIEWGIAAMAALTDLDPAPRYLVAGQTHPKVLAREGEAYRDSLVAQARRLGVAGSVSFDGRYRDAASLGALVRAADVVLLPYDSTEQVTSGVLIEAVAAGKPVVATQFPHAREMLAGGAGLLVPHRDPAAIAAALRSVSMRGDVMTQMAAAAAATAPQLLWPVVADQYRELAGRLITASVAV